MLFCKIIFLVKDKSLNSSWKHLISFLWCSFYQPFSMGTSAWALPNPAIVCFSACVCIVCSIQWQDGLIPLKKRLGTQEGAGIFVFGSSELLSRAPIIQSDELKTILVQVSVQDTKNSMYLILLPAGRTDPRNLLVSVWLVWIQTR